MRLQHIAVMFVIIFIPIILVTSYFISLQVNTVKLESSYTEKLLNATYDAMTAFELNTANENLSSVSDSLRSIIDASNNIFFNTLCTNLGVSNASKSYVQPYIPAILYTLYDGYYIYSPTNIPEVCVDKYGRTIRTSDYGVKYKKTINDIGIYEVDFDSIIYSKYNATEPAPENPTDPNENKQTASKVDYDSLVNKEEYGQILYKNNGGTYSTQLHSWGGAKTSATYQNSTYYKRDYILKSYIPYSASYQGKTDENKDIDVTINYTLDNFMTIEGKIGDIYYTKSGYLIDKELIKEITVDGTTIEWTTYSEEKIDEYIHDPEHHKVIVELNDGTVNDGTVIANWNGEVKVTESAGSERTIYWDDAQNAVEYYVDSFIFSSWVYENLGNIQACNLKNTQYSVSDIQSTITQELSGNANETKLYKDMLYDFTSDSSKPFATTSNDPESEESAFYKHKRAVIKNSITYNMILSMLVYTEESRTVEFNMPAFKEAEWDRILNNVSITAFMEGMKCGLKYFNNYAIVTSTNNEISVTDNEIYYVPRIVSKSTGTYLNDIDINPDYEDEASLSRIAHRIDCDELNLTSSYGAISFKSKEIKYDKILDSDGKFIYDHKVYTDYDCIVDSNYTVTGPITGKTTDGNTDILKYLKDNSTDDNIKAKLLAYRIAIAKERNNLYKTTAFAENYGWQVEMSTAEKTSGSYVVQVSIPESQIKNIKKIEVTIENAGIKDTSGNPVYGVYTDNIKASYDQSFSASYTYTEEQTISTTSESRRTLEFVKDFNDDFTTNVLWLKTVDSRTIFKVDAVKIYYK